MMMLLIAYAVQIGPSGLTFAFQNSASMVPAFFLFFLFGASFGFHLQWPLIIGFIFLTAGIFLSLIQEKNSASFLTSASHFGKWLLVAVAIFLIQGLILSIFQWRSLLLQFPKSHVLIPWACSIQEDMWFMPGFFLVPALVQSVRFYLSERRWFYYKEIFLGIIAGLLNGGATFCLLMATRDPGLKFRPVLFPLFAVTVILLCNLWGKKFYQERLDWRGVVLCLAGVLISSL